MDRDVPRPDGLHRDRQALCIVSLYLATRYPNHPLQVSLSLLRYASAFDKKHGGYPAESKMESQGCFRRHQPQLKRATGARSPRPNLTQHNQSLFGHVKLNMELHTGEEVHPVSQEPIREMIGFVYTECDFFKLGSTFYRRSPR